MPQPIAYDRSALNGETYFTTFSTGYPSTQQPGNKLDQEFNAIAKSVSQHSYNLALIQQDDGALRAGSVGRDQLDESVVLGVGTPQTWAAATTFAANASTIVDGIWYWADSGHTSTSSFATDLGAGLWHAIYDFTDVVVTAALGTSQPPTLASNVGTAGSSTRAARTDHAHPLALGLSLLAALTTVGNLVTIAGYTTIGNLTNFHALANISGFVAFNATNGVTTHTLTATSGEIDLTNGSGVAGAPNIGLANPLTLPGRAYVKAIIESGFYTNAAATGTINLDVLTAAIYDYGTAATNNWTINVRGNSGTSLASLLTIGQFITVAFKAKQGASPKYPNVFQVDGNAMTVKWANAGTVSAGHTSAQDVYTLTIEKLTSAPTYDVLGDNTYYA